MWNWVLIHRVSLRLARRRTSPVAVTADGTATVRVLRRWTRPGHGAAARPRVG